MSDLHGSNSIEPAQGAPTENNGIHHSRVLDAIPDAIKKAPLPRLKSLLGPTPEIPDWYINSRAIDRQFLKQLIDQRWRLQSVLDEKLGHLQQDINSFAEPLLNARLLSDFNITDADALTVQLEVPSKIAFVIDTGASHVRQSTLLEAALHNFEESETTEDAWRNSAGIYRKGDGGSLTLDPAITLPQFTSMCRSLDIGAQYQQHLKSILRPVTPQAQRTLQQDSVASEKAAFHVAALIARLKGDISDYAYAKLGEVREGGAAVDFYDRPLQCHRLSLMGFRLNGIVLFSAVSEPSEIKQAIEALTPALLKFWIEWSRRIPVLPGQEYEQYKLLKAFFANGPQGLADEVFRNEDIYQQSRLCGPLIAYVADDPDHPLKEYASLTEFMSVLIGQLRSTDYQAYFSRFVAQKDKGLFTSRLNERLKTFTWQPREPLDMGPWWRETAVENPSAEPIANRITGDVWDTLFTERRNKALADARLIAVPTGDEDATARFKRLTSYLEIGWNVFNFAAMLVPGVGEAMLGLMIAQMLAEVAEGVEDWSKGDKEQASAYFNGVLINFAQLALMGAGHVLPGAELTPLKISPFVENLKPVEVGGKQRLWNPDLAPYAQPLVVPEGAPVGETGLYRHQEQDLLRLDDKHYAVQQDAATGQHRIAHPTRSDAYQPLLEHNGAGSWKTELDQPLQWDKARLLRRLGASTDGMSDETLEQVFTVSGVHEDLLRRLHVEHEAPPVMLADTLQRFKAYADAQACPAQIRANRIGTEWADLVPRFMSELPGWPEGKAIEVFDGPELSGASIKEGYADALPAQTLRLTREELSAGKLPERVVDFLDEPALREVLGEWLSGDRQARIKAVRESISTQAGKSTRRLFDRLYSSRERTGDPSILLLKSNHPELSTRMAEALLRDADPADVEHLKLKKRVPLTLARQAREAQQQVRFSRAYEGLYLDPLYNEDTTWLLLRSLETLPNWPADLRLEIREYSFEGELSARVGPQDAPVRRVLVQSEQGKYQSRDALDQHLHGEDTLYASILHALPDAQRQALGFEIHDAAGLEKQIKASPLARERLEPILAENPLRKPAYDQSTARLRGGMPGYGRYSPEWTPLRRRASALYPGFSDAEIETLLTSFELDGGSAHVRLTALEAEFNRLISRLQRWMASPTVSLRFSPAGVAEWHSRNQLFTAIRQCWQRTGPRGIDVPGVVRPQALMLDGMAMNRHLASLPELEANFDHVTTLSMRNSDVLPGQEKFLRPFRQVRFLNLEGNLLKDIAPEITAMSDLTDLALNNNRIELNALSVARLRKLVHLRSLGLRGNPLKLAPDISKMPHLYIILLNDTRLDTWPVGLFASPRPRNIYLDLRNNPISRIPEVAPGSVRAELLARTLLSRDTRWISTENLDTLRLYIESVGMDPDRPYPPRGTLDSADWAQGMTGKQWQDRQEIWNAVEDEFDSLPFFNEIRNLTQSADFTAGGTYRTDLTAKVWRMLEAMAENDELRTKLFSEAATPTECVDGGTQLFNAMGVQVLMHEAYGLIRPDLIEAQMIELARGKSRLDELGAIARQRVASRLAAGEQFRRVNAEGDVSGTIDEVEVHLAYMTDLAERLDLPWQARGMQFRKIAGVSKEMIDAALKRVLALEEGDLLADRLLEQPLWRTWLEAENQDDLSVFQKRIDTTTELQDALQRRAEAVEPNADLDTQIKDLCRELGRDANEFADGQSMDDDDYFQALDDIDRQTRQKLKELTQQAIKRARLDRIEGAIR